MKENWKHQKSLEEAFLKEIFDSTPMSYIQGNQEFKVPWITNICFYEADGEKIRDRLGERGFCVSRTSACALSGAASHVLEAIKTRGELLEGAIRFSFGRPTSKQQVIDAAKEVSCIVAGIRNGEK